TFYELYARGVHVATGAYERGDPAQRKERGTHLELSAQWKEDSNSLKASAFASRFSRFIALEGTKEVVEEPGEDGEVASYPVYAFRGVRARFHGVELEARRRVAARPARIELEAR
ncbi:TonB-dependent receptor, partial [Vibrio parahaemolyticus]